MSQSQRVLSGSLTKGSRATEREQLIPYHQGLNVNTSDLFINRINPTMRSGDTFGIFRNGVRMRDTFDDTITLNNELTDLREDQDVFEQRFVFDLERTTFGQPPVTPQLEPLVDLVDFNPVTFIQDEGTLMYPSNLWNLGSLPKHEFDGVIEPLDIRRELLGYKDLRFEGRTFRAGLNGPYSERPWGSKPITDTWKLSDPQEFPFLDAPLVHTRSVYTAPIMGPGFRWFLTASNIGGSTYTEADANNNIMFLKTDATPTDQGPSGQRTPITYRGSPGVAPDGYNIVSEVVGGQNTFNVFSYAGSGRFGGSDFVDQGIECATVGSLSYFNNLIGSGNPSHPTMEFTFTAWVKYTDIGAGLESTSSAFVFALGAAQGGTVGSNFQLMYTNEAGTHYLRVELADISPNVYTSGTYSSPDSGKYVTRALGAGDFLHDGNYHHIACGIKIINNTGAGYNNGDPADDAGRTTVEVQFWIDGAEQPATRIDGISTFYSNWAVQDADLVSPGVVDAGVARIGNNRERNSPFRGNITQVGLWKKKLSTAAVQEIYNVTRTKFGSVAIGRNPPPDEPNALSSNLYIDAFQDIRQVQDSPLIETDYHDLVYKQVSIHNEDDIMNALRLLNSSSCNDITNPIEKTAAKGFYFGDRAGSIVFGDTFTVGEYK